MYTQSNKAVDNDVHFHRAILILFIKMINYKAEFIKLRHSRYFVTLECQIFRKA